MNITLDCAMRTAASTAIVMAAIGIVNPSALKPMLSTCGIGAMRSMRSCGTSASTELVPKMNMIAIIGVAITTEPAIVRTGLRHSPAWIATYSNPPSAPNPILPSRLTLISEATGAAVASGWNAGSAPVATFGALIFLPWLNVRNGTIAEFHPLATAMPVVSIMSLNLLGKMGFGAFGGFEYVAIHAGECRNPVRSIAWSVMLAAPIIAVMFILGTSWVLALVPIDQIDLIAPIPQVLRIGFQPLGAASIAAPLAILAMLCIRIAQASVMFTGNTRLPMVAGWDGLLPQWFTRVHPRFKTPVNSILFVGAATLALSIVGLIGVGKQEAFQLLWNASAIFYALTYLVMFAIPIAGSAPGWVKACALSGLLMTLLFIALSIVPIVQVESRLLFALKLSTLIVVANGIGAATFIARRPAR